MKQIFLYDKNCQLEKLPEKLESPYQRLIAFLGRCVPLAVMIFVIVTCVEATGGFFATRAGLAWMDQFGRPPGTMSGQGSLSAYAFLGATHEKLKSGGIREIFAGDSIMAPNIGGGAASELLVTDLASRRIPGALNLGQEGGEWATISMLLAKLEADPEVARLKPALVVDVDFKFFASRSSFTPAFPIEIPLCADNPNPGDPDAAGNCAALSETWPGMMKKMSEFSPFLFRGLQGQLDFMMTYFVRAPIYEFQLGVFNIRGLGETPFRSFKSGLRDAGDSQLHPPSGWTLNYLNGVRGMQGFIDGVLAGYQDSTHPKHAWLRSLIRTLGKWPGPVLAIYVYPCPNIKAVLTSQEAAGIDQMGQEITARIASTGKSDLRVVSNRSFAPEADDYLDGDHFSAKGHVKLADLVKGAFP